jgi:predicted transcriptional regulator
MSKPNELVPISPEALEILNVYLQTQDINATARELDIHPTQVSQYLRKSEVKNYLDHVYLSAGYRNRDKLALAFDDLIEKKLEEMMETGLGSTKDISELLMMQHKIRMEELKAMADIEKIREGSIRKQTNVQINTGGSPYGEGQYGALLGQLLSQ